MEAMAMNNQGRIDLQQLYAEMMDDPSATYTWHRFVPCHKLFRPDMVIAPEGFPYIYRWYLFNNVGENKQKPNVLFHIQVASDPERPLHDHPWDNTTAVLIGEYDELWNANPEEDNGQKHILFERRAGDVIFRPATVAHRLILPRGTRYTMTMFSVGPKRRDWGFWYPDGWHDQHRHVADRDGQSVHVKED